MRRDLGSVARLRLVCVCVCAPRRLRPSPPSSKLRRKCVTHRPFRSDAMAQGQSASRIVVVSHVLPVRLEKLEGGWVASWDDEIARPEIAISRYTAIGVRRLQGVPCLFVGSPQVFVPRSERGAVDEAIRAAGLNCVCVYHEPSVESRFYQGYCKVCGRSTPGAFAAQRPSPHRASGRPTDAWAPHRRRSGP